jgi:GNAT superfamily N-acetyltransferase
MVERAQCEEWVLADGEGVLLGPLTADDRELTREFVRRLSLQSRYYRFHAAVAEAPAAFTEPSSVALAVMAVEGGRRVQIGDARVAPGEEPGVAEFALAVDDRWQGRGLGSRLLETVERIARSEGYFSLGGDVLRENRPMLRLARRFGFDAAPYAGDASLVRVEKVLDPSSAVGVGDSTIPARRRAAAETVLTYVESRS